jgi:hypothetical protein
MCVFLIAGAALDLDKVLIETSLMPYRTDRIGVGKARTNALYYHISDAEPVTSAELEAAIRVFLKQNGSDILAMRRMDGVDHLTFDIGLVIDEGFMMRTLTMNPDFLALLAETGVTFEISAYRGADDEASS